MRKTVLIGALVILLGLTSATAFAATPPMTLPQLIDYINQVISKIEGQIADLQDQITNIQLIPGPQGPAGPQGKATALL